MWVVKEFKRKLALILCYGKNIGLKQLLLSLIFKFVCILLCVMNICSHDFLMMSLYIPNKNSRLMVV